MKFVQLILRPEGVYTDNAYATTAAIMIPYYDSFHESRLYRLIMAMPNEPKSTKNTLPQQKNSTMKKSTKNTFVFLKQSLGGLGRVFSKFD